MYLISLCDLVFSLGKSGSIKESEPGDCKGKSYIEKENCA